MNSGFSRALLVGLLAWSAATPGGAQWPESVAPGARIRARLPEAQFQPDGRRGLLLRGRVTSLSPDTLYVAVGDSVGPVALPRSMIERLDVSRGVPSRGSSAVRRGLLSAAGFAVLYVLVNEGQNSSDRTNWKTAAAVGAGLGFTVGGVLGALYPRERWGKVRLDRSPEAQQ